MMYNYLIATIIFGYILTTPSYSYSQCKLTNLVRSYYSSKSNEFYNFQFDGETQYLFHHSKCSNNNFTHRFIAPSIKSDIKEEDGFTINYYPNPTSGFIFVTIGNSLNNEALYIDILDVTGRALKTLNIENSFLSLDLSDLSSGIYFLKVSNNNSKLKILKLTIF